MIFTRSFVLFGVSGIFGFFVDAGMFYLFHTFVENPYICRAFSYVFAASFTWAFNRRFSFNIKEPLTSSNEVLVEWLKYLSSQLLGFSVNYTTFALLIFFVSFFANEPVWAIALGSIAGLFINYSAARILVFKVDNSAS